jgi:hypothetical protein
VAELVNQEELLGARRLLAHELDDSGADIDGRRIEPRDHHVASRFIAVVDDENRCELSCGPPLRSGAGRRHDEDDDQKKSERMERHERIGFVR